MGDLPPLVRSSRYRQWPWFKFKRATDIIRHYKNWPIVFLSYFRLLRSGEVTYVLRNGTRLRARANDWACAITPIRDVWLHEDYTRLSDIQEGDYVVDIGAHIGSFTVFATTRADNVKVFSYEPSVENFNFLKENVKLNRLDNVRIFQKAVSGQRGVMRLYIDRCSFQHSTISPAESYEEVDAITLEDILDENQIDVCDFLKIDCEGAEYEILFNAPRSVLNRIKYISLECHIIQGHSIDELKKHLNNMGFIVQVDSHYLYAAKPNS